MGPVSEDVATADPAGSRGPSAAEVRAELERILASRCFEQATRSSSFLRFVVEQTLAGQGERLKGYTIAVEVFARPPDFDAQSDPLVRVEAGRLRRRLIEYYADEGRGDAVRIELPRGGYAVVSTYAGAKSDAEAAAAPLDAIPEELRVDDSTTRTRRRWRRIRSVVVAASIVAGATVILWQRGEVARLEHDVPSEGAATSDGRPPIVVEPFEVLGGTANVGELAAALTEEVFLVLDGPTSVTVPSEPSAAASAMPGYVLSGSVREMDAQVRITARVVRADAGTQLWSAAYDEPLDTLRSPAGQRRIARLVALVAEPYGPIFEAETERMEKALVHEPSTRDCVLRYYEYRRTFAAADHARAIECFELATKREPENAQTWAGLSLLAVDSFAHGFAGQAGKTEVLERAREAARRAMDIDGNNLHANLALTAVQYFGGADFHETAERTLAGWPDNAEAQAYLGSFYLLTGETARGNALVSNAIDWTPEVPSGYYASRSLVAMHDQRYDDALAAALRIDAPDWPLGHLILAAAGALGGRRDLAARAYGQLKELSPAMATSLPEVLRRWRVEPKLAGELERGLAAAAKAQ